LRDIEDGDAANRMTGLQEPSPPARADAILRSSAAAFWQLDAASLTPGKGKGTRASGGGNRSGPFLFRRSDRGIKRNPCACPRSTQRLAVCRPPAGVASLGREEAFQGVLVAMAVAPVRPPRAPPTEIFEEGRQRTEPAALARRHPPGAA
jgi:hypothetical protein